MDDCVFCKIVAGDLPCLKIYEDERVMAFLDVTPVSLGHSLIVPKVHAENLLETPEGDLEAIIRAVKKIGRAAKEATGADGFNLGVNTGEAAGQVVMHTHFHVMLRTEGDGLQHWPKIQPSAEEMEETAEKIRNLLD